MAMDGYFDWTPERVEQLKKYVADGFSFAQIAGYMGCASRNVPLCKWNRLKAQDPELEHPKLRMGGPNPRAVARPKPQVVAPAPKPKPDESGFEAMTLDGVPITEENCTSKMCRFPIGDPGDPGFHYCGHAKKENSSYCEAHHRKVYVPHSVYKNRKRGQRAA